MPTINDQAQSLQYRIKQYRSYYGLRPLWLAFYSEAPRSHCRLTESTRPRGAASVASRSGSTAEQSRSETDGS
ncbi:hypothetical protein ALMP_57750 [Streptomyces sp. A012304]|nr:hypothetical protein ALMP_57750 [Streptomyces sp. A012304]